MSSQPTIPHRSYSQEIPPVNAEIVRIDRGGIPIWRGRVDAYVQQQQEWYYSDSVDGYAWSIDSIELAVPSNVEYDTAEVAPPEPDETPKGDAPDAETPEPPWVPPGTDSKENPYTPPKEPPTVKPESGSYEQVLSEMLGYKASSTATIAFPARPWPYYVGPENGYPLQPTGTHQNYTDPPYPRDRATPPAGTERNTFHYPPLITGQPGWDTPWLSNPWWEAIYSYGGLHWSLGSSNGIIDRTGAGRHGSALGGITIGAGPGKLKRSSGSTYFDGDADRITTNFDFLRGERPDPILYGPGEHPEIPYTAPAGEGFGYKAAELHLQNTYYEGIPETVQMLMISGWAKREDKSANHVLFTTAGPDQIRFYAPRADHPNIAPFGSGYDPASYLCFEFQDEGAWWPWHSGRPGGTISWGPFDGLKGRPGPLTDWFHFTLIFESQGPGVRPWNVPDSFTPSPAESLGHLTNWKATLWVNGQPAPGSGQEWSKANRTTEWGDGFDAPFVKARLNEWGIPESNYEPNGIWSYATLGTFVLGSNKYFSEYPWGTGGQPGEWYHSWKGWIEQISIRKMLYRETSTDPKPAAYYSNPRAQMENGCRRPDLPELSSYSPFGNPAGGLLHPIMKERNNLAGLYATDPA